ncbi:MAG: 6-bladed beta-propeller [Bacteroidaceae bacterium]|jgi:hypothetical protein
MKHFGKVVMAAFCVFLYVGCKKITVSEMDRISITDPASFVDVAFEDVATDIRVVPLISEEPIDQCGEIKCYGKETFIRSVDRRTLYYFNEGQMISKLNRVGRGPGEYLTISNFVFSPNRKILYLFSSGDNSIFQFSVPEMRFLKSIKVEQMTCFAEHDDSTLIVRSNINGENGIYFINANNGEIMGKLKDISGFSLSFNEKMDFYQPKHRILSEIGSTNIISEIPRKVGDEERLLFVYDFGQSGIPKEYDDCSLYNITSLMRLMQYVRQNSDNVYVGGFCCKADKNAISFWYRRINTENKADMRFYWTDGKNTKRYGGFRLSAMRNPIVPDCVTDDGYASILEGSPEFLFDSQQSFSSISAEIKQVVSTQKMNNPVLIYYPIK